MRCTSQSTTQTSRGTMSFDSEKQPSTSLPGTAPTNSSSAEPIRPKRTTTKQALPLQTNTKIMIVWLESLEDHIQFPIGSFIFLSDIFYFVYEINFSY